MSTAIKIEALSKKYLISHQQGERYITFRSAITDGVKSVGRRILHPAGGTARANQKEEFWALKDVSFEVTPGDRLGIIGKNGAGKSTLLKIISRITEPTSGRVSMKGRVSSLLEVGTGFHPELTGRENIFLNGAILGMRKVEILKKFDEIVAFAEMEKFLDTPVKRYSSGMYVRLAFAVAAHLEPEILIIDEVLAVGDAQFQKKCMGKMESVGREGRTILFVSHNMAAVKSLCKWGIVLSRGEVSFRGAVEDAVEQYIGRDSLNKNEIHWDDIANAPENEYIRLKSVSIKALHGSVIDIASGAEITIDFYNKVAGKYIGIALHLFTLDGVCLFTTGIFLSDKEKAEIGMFSTKCVVPPYLLNAGGYKFNLLFIENRSDLLYRVEDVLSFEVEHTATLSGGGYMGRAVGVIRPKLDWTYEFSAR